MAATEDPELSIVYVMVVSPPCAIALGLSTCENPGAGSTEKLADAASSNVKPLLVKALDVLV